MRVRLSRRELLDELADALAAGDCLCARVDDETMVVVHRAAADEAEARTELRFFLSAWAQRHERLRAELL
jgi:hypothetical protein